MIICAKNENKGNEKFVRVYTHKDLEFLLNGELHNYTDSTVAVKRDNDIFIYNEAQEIIKEIIAPKIDATNIACEAIG